MSTGVLLMHRLALLVLAAVTALVTLPVEAATSPSEEEPPLRAIAVAWRHDTGQVASYASYRAAVADHAEQHVRPHLVGDRPNLVAYPEDQGLLAYFMGTRGTAARELLDGGAGAAAAVASLAGPYAPQVGYYAAKFPGVDSPGQLLLLALTDVSVRAIVEHFADVAADLGAYVTVSTNVAAFERVEGPVATLLGDPEADASYAYEATSPEVRNQHFFFSPTGALLDAHQKAYLVPLERERELGLGMTGVEIDRLGLVDLPFARTGTVISKDAWMPDVNERYDQLGATLLIQPEAFDSWGVPGEDLWPPDKFQRSGWLMTQRHPALRANVTPMLTGNFGDVTFDGQPLMAIEAPAGLPGGCLMGQEPEPGWAAVGGWSTLEEEALELCGEDRRADLADRGVRMRPGSGDALENAYGDGVAVADLELAIPSPSAQRLPSAPGASVVPAPGAATQLVPHLAPTADGALLTWVDFRRGRNQSVFAATTADGEAWSDAALVSDQPVREHDHFDNQFAPSGLEVDGGLLAAFLDFRVESWDLYRSRSTGDGAWSANERIDDADALEGTLRERGHSAPTLALAPCGGATGDGWGAAGDHGAGADGGDGGDGGEGAACEDRVVAAWSDLRWPFVHPQVRIAVSDDGGATFSPSVRADGGPLDGDDEQLDGRSAGESQGQHAPALAIGRDGEVLVAWQDHEGGAPHIRVARSGDGGRTFGAQATALAGAPAFRPALAVSDDGTVWMVAEQRREDGGSVLQLARSDDGGRAFSGVGAIDPDAPAGVTQRHATLLALDDGALAVVFGDDRAGDEDVLLAVVDGAARTLHRLDDGPAGSAARAPSATRLPDGRLLVVWQDDRGDVEALRVTTVDPLPRERSGAVPAAPGAAPAPEPVTPPRPVSRLPATGGGLGLGLVALLAAGAVARAAPPREEGRSPLS